MIVLYKKYPMKNCRQSEILFLDVKMKKKMFTNQDHRNDVTMRLFHLSVACYMLKFYTKYSIAITSISIPKFFKSVMTKFFYQRKDNFCFWKNPDITHLFLNNLPSNCSYLKENHNWERMPPSFPQSFLGCGRDSYA